MLPIDFQNLGCIRAELAETAPTFSYVDPACHLPFPALKVKFLGNAATLMLPTLAPNGTATGLEVAFREASDFLPSSISADAIQRAAEIDDRAFGQKILADLLKGFSEQPILSKEHRDVLLAIATACNFHFDIIVDNARCDVRAKAGRFYSDTVIDAVWDVLLYARPTGWSAAKSDEGLLEARKIILPFGPLPANAGVDLKATLTAFFSDSAKVPAKEARQKLEFFEELLGAA